MSWISGRKGARQRFAGLLPSHRDLVAIRREETYLECKFGSAHTG